MKIKDNIAKEFNEFSKNYTNDMIGCVPYYLDLMSCFTENLPNGFNPNQILDLGCGNGNVTALLLKQFPCATYTLVDASKDMIALCQKQFQTYTIDYVESYFHDFSFNEKNYDLIVAGFSLHHCDSNEKRLLFSKIYSSLIKGGILACADLMIGKKDPEHVKLKEQWKLFVHKTFPNGRKWQWLMEHYSEFDKPDNFSNQKKWLKDAGFSDIKKTSYENYWVHFQATKN